MGISEIDVKIDKILSELTLDEKLHMLSSGSGGLERLGIPDCTLGGEAAHGVVARSWKPGEVVKDTTTSFPQPIGMSSSWDKKAIHEAGEIVGREARIVYNKRSHGGLSRWAPTVDLLRDPRWGRNEEAYGEDPVQIGAMASEYVRGIQGDDKDHLMAASTLKHFYSNNTEIGRGWKNSSISPRNKYELYIEPFRRCIEDGGAEGVMTAYNRINGTLGLFNNEVDALLKKEFGLTHAVSDGGAMELSAAFAHATSMDAETIAKSVKAGVDAMSGWPDAVYAGALEAYELGILTEEDIDKAIRNVYRTKIRLGLFEERGEDLGELCSEEAGEVCKDLTDRSLVLLKNSGVLPMADSDLEDTVLIGPVGDKWYKDWYAGEVPSEISLLDGLSEYAPGIKYVDACDRIVIKSGNKFLGEDEEGRAVLADSPMTYVLEDWGEGSYTLRNDATGKYLSTHLVSEAIEGIAAAEEAGVSKASITGRVYADSDRIFSWFDLEVFRMDKTSSGIVMRDRFGNRLYSDKDGCIVSATENVPGLNVITFETEVVRCGIEEAVCAAKSSGNVILALGHNPMVNAKEEIDRETIDFIPYQQKLFDEIYKVKPEAVVVLMSDYPFALNEIDDKAAAILWSSTGSQCMGSSIADALIGKIHPAGRLTQTWYKSDDDLPSIDDYDIIGKERTYRYFKGDVLYPFGYGLTYTKFKYSDMKVIASVNAKRVDDKCESGFAKVYSSVKNVGIITAELTVTNEGSIISDEVVQIYVKAPSGRCRKPLKQLIGFERIRDIAPGEARKVTITVPARELAYYDVISESLIIESGNYEFFAGSSSRDLSLSQTIEIEGVTPGLRDMKDRIKADHYDEQSGSQIVEGLYGFSALMAEGPNVYDPQADGRFTATYDSCLIPGDADKFRIHGYASGDATVRIYVDDQKAGEITLNTREYETKPSETRNHMPRAEACEALHKKSRTLMWADIQIPLDEEVINKLDLKEGHTIRIEADGPFKYDWFMIRTKE
jgi:beta-glucosidase